MPYLFRYTTEVKTVFCTSLWAKPPIFMLSPHSRDPINVPFFGLL